MKIFHLFPKKNIEGKNPWEPWYDKAFGFVIRAENEEEARKLANKNGGDETNYIIDPSDTTIKGVWLYPSFSECVEITNEGEKGIIISDFRYA